MIIAAYPSAILGVFVAVDGGTSSPLTHLGVTALLASLPLIIIACTSFIKIALVLAILRSGLGAPGVPPSSVLTVLAAVLSMFVMAPVGAEIIEALELATSTGAAAVANDPLGFSEARALYDAASPPLLDFLRHNAAPSEVEYFNDLLGSSAGAEHGFRVLVPAFTVGEITEAFLIGFLVFLPFLVIDLIVANTLLALGMHMLSPTAISLPLKLLLFISVDGWHVLLSGLLVNYST
ncbi:MAG: flagellar biosynthetic protein FliP [Deltaproteobacteria bacterium]|nr:flagellar biosynthetic protein FliP [Deltaproteobacteria bacterium]